MLRVHLDSSIIVVLGTKFQKFCASGSDLSNGGIERVLPHESFGSGPRSKRTFDLIGIQIGGK